MFLFSLLSIVGALFSLTAFLVTAICIRLVKQSRSLRQPPSSASRLVIGFFHPYCNAGGGGERVLWVALRNLCHHYPKARFLIYTGDLDCKPSDILNKAKDRFGISLDLNKIEWVYLTRRWYVEASYYPVFTLLGQSLGSILLAYEAIIKAPCHIFVDTMGYAFTYPFVRLMLDCQIVSYTHYPTISTDMLDMVSNRTSQFNNRPKIANSILLSKLKLWYYRIFAFLYGFSGRRSHLVFANSTWTARHLQSLFRMPIHIVYPPCDTSTLSSFSLSNRLPYIVSIAQFRPEKRHRLQVLAFQQCCAQLPKSTQLILMGGCRGQEDETRVEHLRDFIHSLDLDERIKLVLNASYHEIQKYLQQASIGLHTMKEEHFGIGIVEYMAAGLIPLAHRSGGPQTDIVVPYDNQPTGFLADTIEDYAESMLHIFSLNSEEQMKLRENARASVHRFSEKKFDEAWMKHWQQVIPSKLLNLGI